MDEISDVAGQAGQTGDPAIRPAQAPAIDARMLQEYRRRLLDYTGRLHAAVRSLEAARDDLRSHETALEQARARMQDLESRLSGLERAARSRWRLLLAFFGFGALCPERRIVIHVDEVVPAAPGADPAGPTTVTGWVIGPPLKMRDGRISLRAGAATVACDRGLRPDVAETFGLPGDIPFGFRGRLDQPRAGDTLQVLFHCGDLLIAKDIATSRRKRRR